MQSRRDFLGAAAAGIAGAAGAAPAADTAQDRISLAQWSINRSFFENHKWKNLDFPQIAKEQCGIAAVEFVNQFFDNPMLSNLAPLKRNGERYGVMFVRIMCDDEGNMAAIDRKERMQSAVAHRKWVDIANYLGCQDIRCNMRGGLPNWKEDKDLVKRAAESFQDLLAYARGSGVNVIIENHGGASSDADVLIGLMKAVNDPHFGTLPDFGNINPGDDRYEVIRRILPYAKGVSVKGAWSSVDDTNPGWDPVKLIRICRDSGFHGYWGIESSYGRPRQPRQPGQPSQARTPETVPPEQLWQNELKGIMLTKAVLEKALFQKG